ncbi:MAG: hypothetical protein PVH86_11680 [Thiogranum sp.]|jgi:hypothetical protein
MSNFLEQLRLAEKAAEDIYFAKLDRERIAALHQWGHKAESPAHPSESAQTCERANARLL